ncbi:MAG: PhoH family protein [Akkermansiaceae bacterium]|nr:PhoH family protein [Akkermansiaceae bacterium]NNM29718.1 PhoH family protein [Akkermansiaceae bacterium]
MTERASAPGQLRLDFETPQFLHSLFANDPRELQYLERRIGVKTVTREGWVLFTGDEAALDQGRRIFAELEEARRGGAQIAARDFRMAVDLVADGDNVGLVELTGTRLLGSTTRGPVAPRTPHQLAYLKAMRERAVVFGLGPAGTGKTYLAVAMALAMLKEGDVNRVILTRPAVEAGETLGFLPGDMQDKVAPYLRPMYDALHDMLEPEDTHRHLEEGTIEIAPLAYMRGRTLARSFVILDEAQNTTREQMFMLLTRLGEGSHCVITGDGSQVDLKGGVASGLTEAEKALEAVEGVAFVEFDAGDVVRHPVVGRIIDAYAKHRNGSAES